MEKFIGILRISTRRETALEVQKILTEYGCNIKTRLGIHDGVVDQCSDEGLVILELVGEKDHLTAMVESLNKVAGAKAKLESI